MLRKISTVFHKKTAIILISLCLVVTVAVAATLAYLVIQTNELKNTFEPGKIVISVDQSTGAVTNSADSSTSVYVRVAVVVNYQKTESDGSVTVWSDAPVSGTDYDLTLSASTEDSGKWTQDSTGFYYFSIPIAPGAVSTSPVTVTAVDGSTQNASADAAGYKLTVTYLAEAIQSTPTTAVTEAWGVKPTDGKIIFTTTAN